jgi:chromosome segregation protein
MKLEFVEVCGFRGFKNLARFAFPSGFAVLTGRNGAGKSTVLDAIDFALTGTINKFAVTGAKGGGLDEHIWWVGEGTPEKQYVTVSFVDERGASLAITRTRERGLETAIDEIGARLCNAKQLVDGWADTLMRTTLLRDETLAALSLDLPEQARFAAVRSAIGALSGPDHSGRTASVLRAANDAKSEQELRVDDSKANLGRALSALTEARSLAEKQPGVADAERVIAASLPELQGSPADRTNTLRQFIAITKQTLQEVEGALIRWRSLESHQAMMDSEAARRANDNARTEVGAARDALRAKESALKAAEDLVNVERQTDSLVTHLVALLEHGTAVGLQHEHCPLCNSVVKQEQFDLAVAATRKRLSDRGQQVAGLVSKLNSAREDCRKAQAVLQKAEERVAAMEQQTAALNQARQTIDGAFTRWNFPLPTTFGSAETLVRERRERILRLEQALYVLDVSATHDRVTAAQTRVEQLRSQVDEETAKLAAAERAVESARQIDNAARAVGNEILTEQFDTVMPLLKELYRRLRPHTSWREIEADFGGRVRASLNFTVGDKRNPQFLFSSGQRRAAGIAFLLAVHLSRPWCQLRSLLLDDPVQHVDDYRALNLVELLSAVRRTGRQVIVAVEDPALADLLCRRLRSTTLEPGRRFDLCTSADGSAAVESQREVLPLPRVTLRLAS